MCSHMFSSRVCAKKYEKREILHDTLIESVQERLKTETIILKSLTSALNKDQFPLHRNVVVLEALKQHHK